MKVQFDDNPVYCENQWAEDTYSTFEKEYGEEGEHQQTLEKMLAHLAKWADANSLRFQEACFAAMDEFPDEIRGSQSSAEQVGLSL